MTPPDVDVEIADVDVSVILAVPGGGDDVAQSLEAIRIAAAGYAVELIIVAETATVQNAVSADTAADFVGVIFEQAPAGSLTPCLWAAGYRRAGGRIVAFTTAQCTSPPTWIKAMRDGIAGGAAGVGGPLALAHDASATDWAVFHLRYSAFLQVPPNGASVREIPGDNAAYPRDLLLRHESAVRDGFWEVELHRLLRADGGVLRMLPGMIVTFGRVSALGTLLAQRFTHGKHAGWWRVHTGARRSWQIVFAAPLVPAVLFGRILRAIRNQGGKIRIGALPVLALMAAAWAAGEAVGAIRSREPASCDFL